MMLYGYSLPAFLKGTSSPIIDTSTGSKLQIPIPVSVAYSHARFPSKRNRLRCVRALRKRKPQNFHATNASASQ